MSHQAPLTDLILGVDGGGTQCRARLARRSGAVLGEGKSGPANLRLGLLDAVAAVLDAAGQCLTAAGLPPAALGDTVACLALAGASEPIELAAARRHALPFRQTIVTTDAEAACVGAHDGRDGAIIVVGTGSIGWCVAEGRRYRVGGWGLPVSDEGSGGWLGLEAIRRVLWAHDRRIDWSPMLSEIIGRFDGDPHAIVRWAATARPAEYAAFAPLVFEHAKRGDAVASDLIGHAAGHIDKLAAQLVAAGAERIALVGGLAAAIEPHLAAGTRRPLVPPQGDPLTGALRIAASASSAQEAAK